MGPRAILGRTHIGDVFGRLTVVGEEFSTTTGMRNQKHVQVVVQCKCGEHRAYPVGHLVRGRCTSCGCMKGRQLKKHWKHGCRNSKLYYVWNGVRQRCFNKNTKQYHNYGGKGITVCEAWSDFSIFKDWAIATGYTEGLTIDRINPDKNYCPANCQWLTRAENGRKAHTDAATKFAAKDAMINTLTTCLVATLTVYQNDTMSSKNPGEYDD